MTTEPLRRTFPHLSPHGFHRVVYWEWGDPANNDVAICVHGLTRNGRDFDELARMLARRYRVLCPDMPGRGHSEWLRDPNDYAFPTYLGVLSALIAKSDATAVQWVGTSMGGLLGMIIAAQPGSPLVRLVVNDVGPMLEGAALTRIGEYVGLDPKFDTFAQLEQHIRTVSAPFGPLTDAQWRRLSETTARRLPDGRYALNFDPGIAVPFRANQGADTDLWPLWDAIQCPTLLLRGIQSDLLSATTAVAMKERGPKATLVEFPGIGHAPALQDASQVEIIGRFLDVS